MCVCVFNRVSPTGQAKCEGYESPMTVLVVVEPATPLLLCLKCVCVGTRGPRRRNPINCSAAVACVLLFRFEVRLRRLPVVSVCVCVCVLFASLLIGLVLLAASLK